MKINTDQTSFSNCFYDNQPRAIQLVAINEHSKELYLTQQGKYFLININQPISIITIAGLYRTGKSYLVNQFVKQTLNQHQNQGFKVGSTIQSVTKGLNVWSIPIPSEINRYTQKNQNVQYKRFYYLVIDSEGIGSMEQQVTYDLNLLMLIFLISSTVIYNSQGAIDQQSLDQLRVVVNMKKCLNQNASNQPKFIWVLRDFALQLMDKNGIQMSQKQYLEQCLEQTATKNRQLMKKNQIRKAIKQNLKNRSCYTLVRPTLNQSDLGNLEHIQRVKLRSQFLERIQRLKQDVFSNEISDIKTVNSTNVTGPILVQLIQSYLNQINCCKVPQIQSIWEMIVQNQVQQIIQECVNILKSKTQAIVLPLSEDQLKIKLNQIQNKLFSEFQSKILNQNGRTYKKFHAKFMKQVQRINQRIKRSNHQKIKIKNLKELKHFISANINFEEIEPHRLMDMKIVLQRALLKVNGQPQGFLLVIQTIYDICQICHHKSEQILNQNCELKKVLQSQSIQRKSSQLQLMTLKKQYHQILKDVSNHQISKIQLDNVKQCLGQQNLQFKKRMAQMEVDLKQKQTFYQSRIAEMQKRNKLKNQEYNISIKKLREQNNEMTQEIQQLKSEMLMIESKQRKQIIFQEKIQGTWKVFQEERSFFKNQLQKYKQKYFNEQQALKQLQIKFENSIENQKIQKQKAAQKERQFLKQLQWMKDNYLQNKKAYMNTYNTITENDKILKEISNNSNMTQKNLEIIKKNQKEKQIKNTQQNYNERLYKQKQQLLKQIKELNTVIQQLENKLKIQESQKLNLQKEIQKIKGEKQSILKKYKILSQEFQNQRQRFGNSLSLIQQAKNQERSIYEESILKLIGDIQKYGINPRESQPSSRYNSYSSNYFKK